MNLGAGEKKTKENVVFNLPNAISWLRIFSTVLIVLLMYLGNYGSAFVIFVAAALSDYFDGYFARKYGLVTKLGKVLDQMSDKILITSILIVFVELRMVPGWLVIVMVFRDTLVSIVRMVASDAGNVIAANIFGKFKTVSQMILSVGLFLELTLSSSEKLLGVLSGLNTALIYIVTISTVLSGLIYVYQNREYLNR
ncbi:MAG: CDP-diacylglycerol--glycerol-3-phosphate 3-phosphatidyltransferase [Fervidobacterium sp.]|uniref:CDP-diacylglycerol--glycerol-3-phosphate 3-phosphatidyltransferase n=1 Tax=Fervidobacterium sp. TaxID=1871331 RepID=UPI00404AB52B